MAQNLSQDTSIILWWCKTVVSITGDRAPPTHAWQRTKCPVDAEMCCAGMVPPVCGRVQVAGPRRRRSCSEGNKGVPNAAPRRRRAEQEDGCQWWSVFRALRRLASGRASFRPCQPAWRCARTSMDHRAAVQQRPFPSRAAAVRKSAAPEQRRRVPLLRCAGWCPADPAVKNHLSRR